MAAPKTSIDLATYYNQVYSARGFSLAPHHYPIVAALEDTRIRNLLVLISAGAGKSNLLCSVYPTWVIGTDPTMTVLSVSAGEALPQGFMAASMQLIQHDKTFRENFPTVRPAPALGWSLTRGLFVTGHHPSDPDASFRACGVASKALTGLHARLHIYDDIHDRENAATADSRASVKRIYYDTLIGRADPRGVRRVAVGRWWAEDDLYQEWIQSGDWVVMQLPATRPGNARLWYDVMVPIGLDCVFSSDPDAAEPVQDVSALYERYRVYYGAVDTTRQGFYWPASDSKREEYNAVKRRLPRVAAINYDGDMSGATDAIFSDSDFRPYIPPGDLTGGIQEPLTRNWIIGMKGIVESAWDTALGQPQSRSLTAAITGLFVPCKQWHCGEDENQVGPCDSHYDVFLLDLMLKDLNFRELAMALRTQYGLWHPRQVTIEEKQSGVSLIQTFRGTHIPVKGQKVDTGKLERAVNAVHAAESLPIPGGAASVQGWCKMGRVLYPAEAHWITHGLDGSTSSGFLRRICGFQGGRVASDEFDAFVHLVTRAIVLSWRLGKFGMQQTNINEEMQQIEIAQAEDPRRQILNAIGGAPYAASLSTNPLQGLCMAPCMHFGVHDNNEFCDFHNRPTRGIAGCSNWVERK